MATFTLFISFVAPLHAAVTNYVTTTADSDPGSLRQAIANSFSGDVIKFLTEGVITLTSGELFITNNLAIIGPEPSRLAISGNNASRVFSISARSTTSVSGLTIRDGRTTNGASGDRSGVSGTSGGSGGGVYNLGTLAMNDCIITANTTGRGGNGSIGTWQANGSGSGGSGGSGGHGAGIYNAGVLIIHGSVLAANGTGNGGGGGAGLMGLPVCPPIAGGSGGLGGFGGFGGGIYNSGVLTLNACTLSANVTGNGGGGSIGGLGSLECYPFNTGYPGRGGSGGNGGGGGGIWNEQGTVTAINCTFEGNLCGTGGAGTNYPPGYPSILNGPPGVGGSGGAIFNGNNSSAIVSACTLSGNLSGNGGGIFNTGLLSVVNSTIANNRAYEGQSGGIYNPFGSCCSNNVTLRNTLIAQNLPYDASQSSFVSEGHNLIGSKGSFVGLRTNGCDCDLIGIFPTAIDPLLGPLQDNGGPVFTHALLSGSPAIDAGRNSGFTFDDRGQPRSIDDPVVPNAVGGDGTDIGAFEVNHILTGTEAIRKGNDILVRFTTVSDKTYGVEYRPEVGDGPWTKLPGTISGTGGIVTFRDVNAARLPRRFYRFFERAR